MCFYLTFSFFLHYILYNYYDAALLTKFFVWVCGCAPVGVGVDGCTCVLLFNVFIVAIAMTCQTVVIIITECDYFRTICIWFA